MSEPSLVERPTPLLMQLNWLIRLRWVAAAVVIVGTACDRLWLHWYEHDLRMLALGAGIAAYNLALWLIVARMQRRQFRRSASLLATACGQILLDLAALTAFVLWTGGMESPLLGFYVFHMVFASFLLPWPIAYVGAAIATAMLFTSLWATDAWPTDLIHRLLTVGWVTMLIFTVYLANHITRSLRRHRLRLARQNQQIREMTDRLRHQQAAMIQHEKMAALGQMAAGVAHEIANPLASMDSLLQLLQRKPDQVRPDAVETLVKQVDRINAIVSQMTRFAHPGDSQWQRVSVSDMIEQALDMVRLDRRSRGVAVECDIGSDGGSIRVQPQAMQQVLVNLMINAMDAMADVAQPRLLIRATREAEHCLIRIIDNGHGIEPQHMDHLFEPFFTTKPVGKGTGLGLSVSYGIVRQHGGRIEVASESGRGATFTVYVPLNQGGSQD